MQNSEDMQILLVFVYIDQEVCTIIKNSILKYIQYNNYLPNTHRMQKADHEYQRQSCYKPVENK